MLSVLSLLIGYAFKLYLLVVIINIIWTIIDAYLGEFSSSSTADQVAIASGQKLKDKTVIITGCNSGIGKQTAKALLRCGAKIIMACRNLSKAKQARQDILHSLYKNMQWSQQEKDDMEKRIDIYQCDLSSLKSIYSFVENIESNNIKVNILINNAGIMSLPKYTESMDGFELQFATNVLGPFFLTKLLLNTMKKCNNSKSVGRIINISSIGHRFTLSLHKTIDYCLSNKCGPPKFLYSPWKSYGFTKACNILHANEINKRFGNDTNNVYAVSLHPGVVNTELHQNMSMIEYYAWIFMTFLPGITKNADRGAATSVVCATMENFKQNGGKYFVDCKVPFYKPSKCCNGNDLKLQEKLWTLCEKLLSLKGYK